MGGLSEPLPPAPLPPATSATVAGPDWPFLLVVAVVEQPDRHVNLNVQIVVLMPSITAPNQ